MGDFNDYSDLGSTGYDSRQPVDPKDEFFHSVYISGVTRQNQEGVTEHAGNLQLRGVEYNKTEVHMIITHTKQLLAKIQREATGRETVKCFSYQEGPPPWNGTHENHQCGTNSAERAADQWCQECRAQLVVAGVYCDPSGKPVLDEEGKPEFIFIRGKGMKYSGIAEYLSERAQDDMEPLFTPVTDESKKFEKAVVNNKRFVTKMSITEVPSNYGPKKVFKLETGTPLPNETVMEILKIAKKTLEKFNDKFNWSKNKPSGQANYSAASTEGLQEVPDSPPFGHDSTPPETTQQAAQTETKKEEPKDKQFSFQDLDF